jgi:hypothetical protein
VGYLLLKGPVLARVLYTPDEHRGYSDVDMMVAEESLPAAHDALEGFRYRNVSATTYFGVDDVAGVQHAETWNRRGEQGPLLIDLHWRLPGCDAPPPAQWEALSRAHDWMDLEGARVAVPARPALALHLAIHAAQHGGGDLKAMADLGRGVERWPPEVWRSAAGLADELEGMDVFAAGLRLLPEGERLAAELDLPETATATWEIVNRASRPRGTFHLRAFSEARGARERADVLRRSLFPTRRWIELHHRWAARSPLLLPAAYLAHLLRAPVWALRAWRYRRRARAEAGTGS